VTLYVGIIALAVNIAVAVIVNLVLIAAAPQGRVKLAE